MDHISIDKPVSHTLLISQIRLAFPELINFELEKSLPEGGNRFLYCQRDDGSGVDLYTPDDFTQRSELAALIMSHNAADGIFGEQPPLSAAYMQAEYSRKRFMESK